MTPPQAQALQGASDPSGAQLQLTARLNTSALDARRGVVLLHPEAIAALGIREWDAVSLTGTRTTCAVVGSQPRLIAPARNCSSTGCSSGSLSTSPAGVSAGTL